MIFNLSLKHTATTGDLPLAYTEKSIQSILLSSISDAGAVAFAEQPVRRKHRGQGESYGWVDLWAFYRQVTYMIETKHSGVAWKTGKLCETTTELWKDAVRNVKAVTRESLDECTHGADGMCKIALLTLRVWHASKFPERLHTINEQEICDLGAELAQSLKPQPTWCAAWTLSNHLQKPVEWYADMHISYPGVVFLAWVDGPYKEN